MILYEFGTVIAAVKTKEDFGVALESGVKVIFDLSPDLHELAECISSAHAVGKKYFAHLDLATGIGKDKSGVLFMKKIGADGVITTRSNIVKIAKELSLPVIQRFFAVDSKSLETAVDSVNSLKPDMVEIMPGLCVKAVLKVKEHTGVPVIAGGLIETDAEIKAATDAGAFAVSTGNRNLWR